MNPPDSSLRTACGADTKKGASHHTSRSPREKFSCTSRFQNPNYIHLSWIWQLFAKIARHDREKSSFLWTIYTNFWQACWNSISAAPVLLLELERLYESFPPRFALPVSYEVLLFEYEDKLRLYKPCAYEFVRECICQGAWAPGRAAQIWFTLCFHVCDWKISPFSGNPFCIERRASEQNSRQKHHAKISRLGILRLQFFPWPLAFRIWNYMHLSPSWTLLRKMYREYLEISSFEAKIFRKIRQALSAKFVPVYVLETSKLAVNCQPGFRAGGLSQPRQVSDIISCVRLSLSLSLSVSSASRSRSK